MSLQTKNLNTIRKAGIEMLTKELGPVETAYFIRQFDMGNGDYTKERDELLKDIVTIDDFKASLRNLKGKKYNEQGH
jgi:hypothetical protein